MNKATIFIVVVLLLAGGYWFLGPKDSASTTQTPESEAMEQKGTMMAPNTVELKDFAFNPSTLTVPAGTTVTFTNNDLAGHTVTADDGSFESEILGQGESTTVTFDAPGTFTYHCTPHPNMKLTVVVE